MKGILPVLLMATLGACVMAPRVPAPAKAPPELLSFYTDADAYRTSAERRLCADMSLRPRFQALQLRLAAATQTLLARYGREQIDASRVAVVTSGTDLCTNRAAAATSLNSFEAAVSDLEAALR